MSTPRPPAAFLIGAAKAGTTSLAHLLNAQPGLQVNAAATPGSELRLRDADEHRRQLGALFTDAPADTTCIAYSTDYARHPFRHGATEIAAINPDARLVYQVREPIERMRSNWRMRVRNRGEVRSFAEVAAAGEDDAIVTTSMYGLQLRHFLEHVDEDAICVTWFDDFVADPGAVVAEVLRFLGHTAPPVIDQRLHRNRGSAQRTPRVLGGALRSTAVKRVRNAVPAPLRQVARAALTREVVYPPDDLPDDLRDDLRHRFAGDYRTVTPLLDAVPAAWQLPTIED